MSTGKALLGVLAGMAAGTVIGILLAPDKADKLRKNISRKSEDLADAINDKIDEKFEELLGTISGKVKKGKTADEAAANNPEG
jgi:gas vesicle protein